MDENHRRLKKLHQLIGDLGYSWSKGIRNGGVIDVMTVTYNLR